MSLDEDIEEFHYSDKPFNTSFEYTLNLTGKPNYIMLQNQRMIKNLYLNELGLSSEQYSREKRIFKRAESAGIYQRSDQPEQQQCNL